MDGFSMLCPHSCVMALAHVSMYKQQHCKEQFQTGIKWLCGWIYFSNVAPLLIIVFQHVLQARVPVQTNSSRWECLKATRVRFHLLDKKAVAVTNFVKTKYIRRKFRGQDSTTLLKNKGELEIQTLEVVLVHSKNLLRFHGCRRQSRRFREHRRSVFG